MPHLGPHVFVVFNGSTWLTHVGTLQPVIIAWVRDTYSAMWCQNLRFKGKCFLPMSNLMAEETEWLKVSYILSFRNQLPSFFRNLKGRIHKLLDSKSPIDLP